MLGNLALLLVSGLAGLLLCEIGLRLFHPKYQYLAEAAFVRDPTLIYSPIPNHCGTFPHPDTAERHSVCHNSFFLHVVPVDKEDLPPDRLEHGFDNRNFFAVADEATCSVTTELPSYPIEHIFTGQFVQASGERLWDEEYA